MCFRRKIKALNIAFKPLCCKSSQKVVNMWLLLGFWGQRSSPVPTVHGLWHFTMSVSPLQSLYSKGTNQIYRNNSDTNKKANCGFLPFRKEKGCQNMDNSATLVHLKKSPYSLEINEMLILSSSLLRTLLLLPFYLLWLTSTAVQTAVSRNTMAAKRPAASARTCHCSRNKAP